MFSFRIDDEVLARWRVAAEDRGVPLATLIRSAVEREIGVEVVHDPPASPRLAPAVAMRPRAVASVRAPVPCSKAARHRAGTFCRYCGQTP